MCEIRIRFDQLITVNFSDLLSYKIWVLAVIFSLSIHIWGQTGCTYTVGTTEKDGWLGPTIFFPFAHLTSVCQFNIGNAIYIFI